ncbi:MAG: PadR family transcriptional regulator [Pseudomonadales bacterium]|nr:PadR family transcriptional regulator [Pseudomonadales bacterium]
MLDKIILGLLHTQPHSAYSLQKAMEKSTNFFYGASQGNIHPTLKRMASAKLVATKKQSTGSRPRIEYTITRMGRQEFKNWVNGPLQVGRVKDDALVKLFFLGHVVKSKRQQIIKEFQQDLAESRAALLLVKELNAVQEHSKPLTEVELFRLETIQYGIDYFEFTEKWYKKLLERV